MFNGLLCPFRFASVIILFSGLILAMPGSAAGSAVPPAADAGDDIVGYVGQDILFKGYGVAPFGDAVCRWDFDGDGVFDTQPARTGQAVHPYKQAGKYEAVLRVTDGEGQWVEDTARVTILPATGEQQIVPRFRPVAGRKATVIPADGVVNRYAVMINGSHEERFWIDVVQMYNLLIDEYAFTPERIHLFNSEGMDPYGGNPDGMIDDRARLPEIDAALTTLAGILDADDELLVWIDDHGNGYSGPTCYKDGYLMYGYLASYQTSVDPGDEQDYLESDFKLRGFITYGYYGRPDPNHGMNEWKVSRQRSGGMMHMCRYNYVSHFTDLVMEDSGTVSDNDIYIERLTDCLRGDFNRDTFIDTGAGEMEDYDGDGIPPYDSNTGELDPDDWGAVDIIDDNYNHLATYTPGGDSLIFDAGLDNHLDIDLAYTGGPPHVDGTDVDNLGLFDGLDINGDGDMNDWVSIDEVAQLAGDKMYDDDLAIILDRFACGAITVFMQPCHSGGFIDDLSGPGRVLTSSTEEETLSFGNDFARAFAKAFAYPRPGDANGDGRVSMAEAFNYAGLRDTMPEIPQYDDNGDGVSHTDPIPAGGDGAFGATVFLTSYTPTPTPTATPTGTPTPSPTPYPIVHFSLTPPLQTVHHPAAGAVQPCATAHFALTAEGIYNTGGLTSSFYFEPACVYIACESDVWYDPFMASTGNTVTTYGPYIYNASGRVNFDALTSGPYPGPDGTGDLLHWSASTKPVTQCTVTPITFYCLAWDKDWSIYDARLHGATLTICYYADQDCDDDVDVVDIQQVAGRWNSVPGDGAYDREKDVDRDGDIDIVDIQKVAGKWNTVAPFSP